MFRLTNKDVSFYLLERMGIWGIVTFGLCIVYFVICIVGAPTHPHTASTTICVLGDMVGLIAILGIIPGFVLFLASDEKNEKRCELVRRWKRITHLSIFLFPRDEQEAGAMSPHLQNILGAYADASEAAFKSRDEMRGHLDASSIGKIAKPGDLHDARFKRSGARIAFNRAAKKAEREHDKYLAAWDYLTHDPGDDEPGVGLLRNLQGCDPKDFSKNMHAID